MGQHAWLKIIHGTCADAMGLERIVMRELRGASVVRIVGAAPAADPLEAWSGIAGRLGAPADLSAYGAPGGWMDRGFEPNGRQSGRPGELAQPLHNDAASVAELSGAVGVFYVARQASGGGQALFIDAGAVAEAARRHAPELYEQLFSVPVRFGRAGGPEQVRPVLRREGGRLTIAWNEHRILDGQADAVEPMRRALRLMLLDMTLSGEVSAQRLETGDAVFFHADEVLHGRAAYAVRGGDEGLVWKRYVQTETLKVLAAI